MNFCRSFLFLAKARIRDSNLRYIRSAYLRGISKDVCLFCNMKYMRSSGCEAFTLFVKVISKNGRLKLLFCRKVPL